ncbi:MAG TPA: molybdenum cofactor guanylyltransferase MobA [Solimonas sp.]|nr:molybdenum cofactor guanylyltransferase MobA [Solimonas sp.]
MNQRLHSVAALPLGVTAAILAGGRGERLGGADKGLVSLRGRPLYHYVRDAVAAQAGGILIVANRHLPDYAASGLPVVSDPWPDFRGPLAGMLAALQAAPTDWVLTAPCDAVRLPDDLLARLRAAVEDSDAPAAYATDDGDAHYVCCLLNRSLLVPLQRALDAGERAPKRWLADIGAVTADFSAAEPTPIWSINTPAELEAATSYLEHCHG